MYSKANSSPGKLVHHYKDPVSSQRNGLSAKQVDTPESILGMTKDCQPGWSVVSRARPMGRSKDSSHNIFIQVQPETQVDLLSDPWAAESGVSLLHLDNGFDDFL